MVPPCSYPNVTPESKVTAFCLRWIRLALVCLIPTSGLWFACTGSDLSQRHGGELVLVDVTTEAGLGGFKHVTGAAGDMWLPEAMGSGCGFIDYDTDGWLDILLVGGGNWPQRGGEKVPGLWLYRNNGDGTFSLKSEEAGLGDISTYGFGVTVADYDNDGDPDFFFTSLWEDMLFRNDDGVFTEVAEAAGFGDEPVWSTAAIFFDSDRDGWLDLYVGSYVQWIPEADLRCTSDGVTKDYCTPELYTGIPGRFYRNNGDGTFTDLTEAAGFFPAPGKTLGVAELDITNDGWPDLIVANDTQRDLLYENQGDGTFVEKGQLTGVAYDENGRARAGMGVDGGVVDQTGQPTIFVGNFSKEMIGVYRYGGDGLFVDRAATSKIGRPSLMTLTFGLFLFDSDLDGDLDLFTANGHIQKEIGKMQDGITYREPSHLFVNDGDGSFEDKAPDLKGVMSQPLVGRGAAYGDFDRNGKLDILVTENGGPVHLWRNDLVPGDHFLRVHLEGRESNRDGIGSRVVAVVGNRRMERRVRTGSSFLSSSEKTVTFGVGKSASIDSLIIYWPSGLVEEFSDVHIDQEVHLVEGSGSLKKIP